MADYKVKFEVFEGPLDLLLYLIKKDEIDIYEVNLTTLAKQFIEYIELMRELDLDVIFPTIPALIGWAALLAMTLLAALPGVLSVVRPPPAALIAGGRNG